MGKGSNLNVAEDCENCEEENLTLFHWEQIRDNKKWIVIDNFVYDVSRFSKKHPGGERVMLNHIGQDASVRSKFFENI